jgi:hypothetical protein
VSRQSIDDPPPTLSGSTVGAAVSGVAVSPSSRKIFPDRVRGQAMPSAVFGWPCRPAGRLRVQSRSFGYPLLPEMTLTSTAGQLLGPGQRKRERCWHQRDEVGRGETGRQHGRKLKSSVGRVSVAMRSMPPIVWSSLSVAGVDSEAGPTPMRLEWMSLVPDGKSLHRLLRCCGPCSSKHRRTGCR